MLSINSSSATVNRVQPNKAAVSGAGNKPKTGPVAPVGQPLPAGAVLSRFNVTTPDGKTVMLEEALRTSSKYVSKTTQGDLVFIAPATGSTTPNSDSTRSELRETDATGKLKNWNPYVGTHVLEGQATVEQAYIRNTPVLRTVLTAKDGASVEIIDFAPRHPKHSRTYRPLAFGRILRPLSGAPTSVPPSPWSLASLRL